MQWLFFKKKKKKKARLEMQQKRNKVSDYSQNTN